ncbi:hypothetical protein UPYG_G00017540 [Umbra pygmaea]|uniref:Zinc finger (CCCH type), RNA-binding motif and serine/arginine rich 2 n=1 Tax=Umbra pygmaea TaxID=75934 RepID=A0ABD0XML8_UMBPY
MASSMPCAVSARSFCQKRRASLKKKERRKRKRQALAKAQVRESGGIDDGEDPSSEGGDDEAEKKAEEERQRLHAEWLERERLAQEEFRLRCEREEMARKRKEEEEARIKEEWEAQQKREEEEKEQKQQDKRNREEAVQKMLDQAESQLENGGPWKNPEAPDFGTEQDRANCPFFLKTGACRFGDRCSRKHVHPPCSTTLMIRGMFATFGMDQRSRDDYDTDACLEYSEEEVLQQFVDFYEDVLPEFRNAGKVVQFKVSCNFEPHLRGNVYVQFDTEEQCREAFMIFNGRWYAGKQLQCEFSPVTRWKTAICGLFDRQKCPKGKHCNFLHVYRNPGNEFWEADRDLHMSPDRGGGTGYSTGRFSERSNRSSWTERSQSRRGARERRSHSRERRSHSRERRSHSRERRRLQHQRASGRSDRSWVRFSSTRPRSRSRDKGERSRKSVRRNGSGSRREGQCGSPTESRAASTRRSRSGSPGESSRRKRRADSGSPPQLARKHRHPINNAAVSSPSHRKNFKKSKKKKSKKKKHKKEKKKGSPVGQSSSEGSGKDSGGENPSGVYDDVVHGTQPSDVDGTAQDLARANAIQSLMLHRHESETPGGDIQNLVKAEAGPPRLTVVHGELHSPSHGDMDTITQTRADSDHSCEVNALCSNMDIKTEPSLPGESEELQRGHNQHEKLPNLLDDD